MIKQMGPAVARMSVMGMLLAGTAAMAQTTPPIDAATGEASFGVEEIVVSARRRSETLVDVPIAINAFSSDTIEQKGLSRVDDVSALTPGLQFDRGSGPADIRPSLRGIALVEGRSNVAIVVDGVDVTGVTLNSVIGGSGSQTAAALMDLERIEVVKGPQTVYFGRSAFAGAIQFISREPSFTPEASVSGALGDHGRREITGHISGPLIEDTLAAKLSATYRNFDGFYTNPGNGQHLGASETWGIGGSTLLETGDLRIKAQVNYLNQHDTPGAGYVTPRADITPYGVNKITEDSFDESQIGFSSHKFYVGNKSETWRGIVSASLDLGGGFELNTVSGFNKVTGQIEFDFDTKPDNEPVGVELPGGLLNCLPGRCVGIFDFDTNLQQISQEVRLSYDSDDVRLLLGGFFFDENYREVDYTRFVGSQPWVTDNRSNIPGRLSALNTNTYSVFGSVDVDVTSALTLTGEMRFNHEIIRATGSSDYNMLFSTGSSDVSFRGKKSFNSWLPRVNARLDVTDNANVYASIAKGSKPGGFNVGSIRDDLRPFGQETIWTYELGTKGRFFDRRLSLEASVYYSDWRDVQVTTICYGTASVFGPEEECPTATAVSLNYIINANKAEVKGFELGASGRPTDWLTLNLNYAFTDSKFKDFLARDVFPAPASDENRQFGGNRVQLIPKHSLQGSVRVETAVADEVDGFAEVSGRYRSSRYARFDNRVLIGAKTVFDVQFGLKSDDWTALVFVDNLFNDLTPEFSRFYGNWNPSRTNGEWISAPMKRSFGIRLSKNF